jgi:geranylgeranyl diphosphate synthase type II
MEGKGACVESRTPTGAPDWRQWYEDLLGQVNAAIATHLKRLEVSIEPHSRLAEAVQYSLGPGGKRFRPVLVVECCRVCGGLVAAAMPAAIAVECVHTFSLVHDDLPAMDDDELRRGKPCNHKVFGEALAILAGDWLATHALALLAAEYPPDLAAALTRALSEGTLHMIAGQAADVAGEDRPTDAALVEFIHLRKTAGLIEAACRMGALCAAANDEALAALGRFGRHLGLAFQITDDLLDVTGSTAVVGKRVGKDATAAKQTYPAAFGVESSRVRARAEIDAALAALEPCGPSAESLRGLARYIVARDR